ncbi:hypothetical protein SKB0092_22770 [Roseomonas mucosa]
MPGVELQRGAVQQRPAREAHGKVVDGEDGHAGVLEQFPPGWNSSLWKSRRPGDGSGQKEHYNV